MNSYGFDYAPNRFGFLLCDEPLPVSGERRNCSTIHRTHLPGIGKVTSLTEASIVQMEPLPAPHYRVARKAPDPEAQRQHVAQRQQPEVAQHLPISQYANTYGQRHGDAASAAILSSVKLHSAKPLAMQARIAHGRQNVTPRPTYPSRRESRVDRAQRS